MVDRTVQRAALAEAEAPSWRVWCWVCIKFALVHVEPTPATAENPCKCGAVLDNEKLPGKHVVDSDHLRTTLAAYDRLRDILACECGERAPEGWEATTHNGEIRWIRELGTEFIVVMCAPYQPHIIWRRGQIGNFTQGGAPYGWRLEAIEAADNAAKESK